MEFVYRLGPRQPTEGIAYPTSPAASRASASASNVCPPSQLPRSPLRGYEQRPLKGRPAAHTMTAKTPAHERHLAGVSDLV